MHHHHEHHKHHTKHHTKHHCCGGQGQKHETRQHCRHGERQAHEKHASGCCTKGAHHQHHAEHQCRHGGRHGHDMRADELCMAGLGGGHGRRRHGMGRHDDHFDQHAFGGGRRLGSEDLQLIVLALLEQKPRHGYELIKALEAHSQGFYAPSPGMVYPILTFLEESDQATVSAAGNKKQYTITADGIATLNENRERVEIMLDRLQQAGQRMQQMQQMYAEETAGAATGDVLHETVHALRSVLRDKRLASAEEKQRIAEILQRALKEIQ